MDKAQRLTAARMAADRYAGVARAKGFKRHVDGVSFIRADADLTWDDKARAFRVTLYKMDGRSRVAVATVRANAMLNVLLKSFI
ncbi:hypothetical protein DP815_21430 [Salmonella enterica subsp. enterica serovar Mikawasima]|nr:hypothetical protein [Salmonella enterica subsp. enterica serovar Altona]EBW6887609.1 hypothetical protein [Salmonella enterica subsp. enterica serovar Mikawasima]EDI2932911.1 hypothetical protein [Salmonella enterica subsp. enterica serovar Infantis]